MVDKENESTERDVSEGVGGESPTEERTTDKSEEKVEPKAEAPAEKEVEKDVRKAKEASVDVEEFDRTRKALEKANKEAQDRRHKLREWDELGVEPEKVRALLDEQREAEIKKAEEEGRYQELLDKMKDETNQKVSKADEKVNQMKSQLESYLVDKNLTEAIAAEDGIPKLLEGIAQKYVSAVEGEDGSYKTLVSDEDGKPRLNEKGDPMSIRELIASFKEDDDLQYAFKAPKVSGTGSDGQSSSAPSKGNDTAPKPKKSSMSPKQQREYVAKHGYPQFAKLPS